MHFLLITYTDLINTLEKPLKKINQQICNSDIENKMSVSLW